MDVKWVKVRSYHAVRRSGIDGGHFAVTHCGRFVENPVYFSDLPAEKSCESCLRSIARLADKS